MISGSPAVRRELERFELARIFITDSNIEALAEKQAARMKKEFGTNAIPLHVVLAPDGRELSRFTYSSLATPDTYIAFLRAGMAKFNAK
jgi:hypothetical protein